jgi:outer membrane receptor protein involved in Fe transport
MKHPLVRSALCILAVVALVVPFAKAQTVTGSLVGRVTDSSDAVMVDARVVAVEVTRGVARETRTNESGTYSMASMEPGVYRIEMERGGFKKFVSGNVEVSINSTVRVDAKMVVGDVSESIQVAAEGAGLKTDRADLSQQIQHNQVANLPLSIDRNYMSVLTLVPGATEPGAVGSPFGNPSGSLATSVNGQNNRGNSYQIDGTINNQTNVVSQSAVVPPPEAIQVIEVSTNAFDVEAGRATGGAVNVQIKSGTNALHSFVWAYNTNSAAGARNSLSTLAKQHTNLNQFGFTLGGPVRKDRTFFFGDYQGGRDRRGENTLVSIPSLVFRSGNLSAAKNAIYDPVTGNPDGSGRTQFPGNVIPANRISPVTKAIFGLLPPPNLPGETSNYAAGGSFGQNRNSTDIKVNHKFTDMTQGFVRYSYLGAFTSDPPILGDLGGVNANGGNTAAVGPSRIQSLSTNLTHVFGPSLVGEFRAGFERTLITGGVFGDPDIAAKLGIPGVRRGDFFSVGMANVSVSGYTSLGNASTMPFKIADTAANLVTNWNMQRGNHSIRWGMDFRDLILNTYQSSGAGPRGLFTFTTTVTSALVGGRSTTTDSSNALAAFLLGLPGTISRTTVFQLGGWRLQQYYSYIQDRWQVSPKLTANWGLRYEVVPFARSANPGDQSRYDPATNRLLVGGYGPNNSRLNINTDYRNFAPRLGVAYRLGAQTVLRAGYGVSYTPQGINSLSPKNYPSSVQTQSAGANSLQPAGNIANGAPVAQPVDVSSGVVAVPSDVALSMFNPNGRRGYVQAYNLTAEHGLAGFLFTGSYVGNLGTRISGNINLNAAAPGSATAARPFAKLYGRTADVTIYDYMISSSYHALQTKVERRVGKAGSFTASYTLSKSLDYSDSFTVPIPLNIDVNRGPSVFDRKHNLVISHVVPLPFGKGGLLFKQGPMAAILGGFQVSGIFSARTGAPFGITGVRTAQATGQGFTNRPNVNGPVKILGGAGRGELWFDTSAFSEPAPGMIGNVGRNLVRGPGYVSDNLTLARIFAITERVRLNFMLTTFNLTNTTHFGDPTAGFTNVNFGQITSSFGERQVQIGARLEF